MSRIFLENCDVDLPVYGLKARSLKGALISAATGGRLASDSRNDLTVIRSLSGISLNIGAGERVALIGHNGAGKSTLLRLIAGIYDPTHGSISVEGKIVSLLDLSAGMDLESTGYENIKISALMHGIPSSRLDEYVRRVAEFSELEGYLELPIRVYSSGMLMRLAFSIATDLETDILLMDEWISVGDADFIHKAEERLKTFIDRAKILAIATHSTDLVQRVCNRVIELEHGVIKHDSSKPQTGDLN